MIGIYKITSPSNKVYIGQSWDINRRFSEYQRRGAKGQNVLQNSFIKYGVNSHNFKVIHELPCDISQEVLNNYEQIYMDFYSNCVILMNIREAGSRGKHSESTKELMRNSAKGKVKTKQHSDNISKGKRGKKINSLYEKRSSNSRGEKNPNSLLLEKDVIFIRNSYDDKSLTIKELCEIFKLTRSTIEGVIYYRSWKYLTDNKIKIKRGKYQLKIRIIGESKTFNSQKEVAHFLNVSEGTICYWLKKNIKIERI